MLRDGVEVKYRGGTIRGDRVWLVDFEQPARNDWLVVNQFAVCGRVSYCVAATALASAWSAISV